MNNRSSHSIVTVNNKLYNWGGQRADMPEVHNSDLKSSLTSRVEVFDITGLSWSSITTTGVPPAAIMDYSCCTTGSKVYMFGGSCMPDDCYHNDLFMMDTLSNNEWSQIEYSNSSSTNPMKKLGHGMMSITNNKEEYLLIIGGYGPTPTSTTPNKEYIPDPTTPNRWYTSEVHLLSVTSPCQLYHY